MIINCMKYNYFSKINSFFPEKITVLIILTLTHDSTVVYFFYYKLIIRICLKFSSKQVPYCIAWPRQGLQGVG